MTSTVLEMPRAMPVDIPFPEIELPHLRITAVACFLRVRPGADDAWVRGTYRDPSGRIELHVCRDAEGVELRLGTDARDLFALIEGPPRLELKLGTRRAFRLTLDSGASETRLDLGGVPLTRVDISEGAGRAVLDFSAPNPVELEHLRLGVGAGAVEARGLANAAFEQMRVEGGAAGVQLEFNGSLRVNGRVEIATALSGVEVTVPTGVAAEVTWSTLLGVPDADATFVRRGDAYFTPAALAGAEPELIIHNAAALGGLRLLSA
jgi:hypothetical protein